MKFLSTILAVVPSLIAPILAQNSSCGCTPNITYADYTYQSAMIDQYISMWEGNLSLIDQTVSPNVQYFQDQFPIVGEYPIFNSSALLAFIKHSRVGWSSFEFMKYYKLSTGYRAALRWRLEGIISNSTDHYPTATAANGTHISYNGTDVYFFNPCTGLIDEVDSATDYIDYFAGLGVKTLTLA